MRSRQLVSLAVVCFGCCLMVASAASVHGVRSQNPAHAPAADPIRPAPAPAADNVMDADEFKPSFGDVSAASRHTFYPSDEDEFRPSSAYSLDDESDSSEYDVDRLGRRNQRQPIDITTPAAQSFLPSFFRDTQPHGHSRPYYAPTEAHRFNGNRAAQQVNAAAATPANFDQTILGSGDFGVIRGGTFYQENDPPARALESNDFFSFFKNNGHGRPQTAALTSARSPAFHEEQFSNFRDFADINSPSDPAFSQFVVVYANKNATVVPAPAALSDVRPGVASPPHRPKNIFEQLEELDREASAKRRDVSKPVVLKATKTTFKQKLAATKREKTYRKRVGPKEHDLEPLMALS